MPTLYHLSTVFEIILKNCKIFAENIVPAKKPIVHRLRNSITLGSRFTIWSQCGSANCCKWYSDPHLVVHCQNSTLYVKALEKSGEAIHRTHRIWPSSSLSTIDGLSPLYQRVLGVPDADSLWTSRCTLLTPLPSLRLEGASSLTDNAAVCVPRNHIDSLIARHSRPLSQAV
jgi:hypothetical protein